MEKHKEVKESRKKGLVIWIAKSLNHSDGNKGIKVWVTKIEKHKEVKESWTEGLVIWISYIEYVSLVCVHFDIWTCYTAVKVIPVIVHKGCNMWRLIDYVWVIT